MNYLSRIGPIKDIPQNIVISIFLAGVIIGFLAAVVIMMIISTGRERSGPAALESPHDVIMEIKKRVKGRRAPGPVQCLIYLVIFILLLVALFAIVAIGRYMSEGRPAGEEFIPFILRMFIFPLLDRFPALQGFIGQ
jgi:hypothetical protein